MNRRSFITGFAAASGGVALACGGLARRAESLAANGELSSLKAAGYGELVPTATKNTGETYLALPKGFEYNVFGKVNNRMSDARPTPAAHDGMATFRVKNELRIIRNHEIAHGSVPRHGVAIGSGNHYDEMAGGGTTTLVINPNTREIVRDFVSLSGTLINCAGGPTPWGSWISCEETTLGPTVRTASNGVKTGGFPKPHGYCFEVSASANNNVPPVPLKAMGRFVHEAVAVDKASGVVYLTEDYNTSGFYRFLPRRTKRLADGGVLQMLAIKEKPRYDTRRGQTAGVNFAANWVNIANPDPAEADVDPISVYKQGLALGAATFARLEGCFVDSKRTVYFTATSGGDNGGGQIWRYSPTSRNDGVLTLVFESPSRELLDMPDNICPRPASEHIFICEDSDYVGQGGTADNYIRILTPAGKIGDFAKNITPNFVKSEFAGAIFSHDGRILFVNLQAVGATFAIWGDWNAFHT